jgi:GntR family transcriptional regulator, transcriptional repressor for pyruvate dehydrogenase complex
MDHVEVADAITKEIGEGALEPGQLLPGISQLAERYGVSESAVKGALLLLSSRGLIRGPDNGRVYVNTIQR